MRNVISIDRTIEKFMEDVAVGNAVLFKRVSHIYVLMDGDTVLGGYLDEAEAQAAATPEGSETAVPYTIVSVPLQ